MAVAPGAGKYIIEAGEEVSEVVARNGVDIDSIPWITPNSLPLDEESAVLDTLQYIDNNTRPSGKIFKRWNIPFHNREGHLPIGNYVEYRVAPPEMARGAGVRRLVKNVNTGELFYTWTHYGDTGDPAFVRIR